MMTALRPLALLLPLLTIAASPPQTPAPSPGEIVAAAPASAWSEIDPARLMVVDLVDGSTVAIELAPDYAPIHVRNIVMLARAGWFDGTSINRVQDNYVVQWGDATEAKALPAGIVAHPPAEYDWPAADIPLTALPYRDAYAPQAGHAGTWPAASDGARTWLVHCYGMIGVGRGLAPDTGTGAELYTVIGHAPRHLDRNITLVGRIVAGMETLTARPRGTEALGFYRDPAQRVTIRRVRMADTIPTEERPRYEVLASGTPTFAAWINARANRKDDFFVRPAGAVDICNAQATIRPVTARR